MGNNDIVESVRESLSTRYRVVIPGHCNNWNTDIVQTCKERPAAFLVGLSSFRVIGVVLVVVDDVTNRDDTVYLQ